MTANYYDRAIDILSSIELDKILQDFSNTNRCREIKQVIRYYQDLSETQLITIRDLLRVMLTLKSQAPRRGNRSWLLLFLLLFIQFNPEELCKTSILWEKNLWSQLLQSLIWPPRRLEYAANLHWKKRKKTSLAMVGWVDRKCLDAPQPLLWLLLCNYELHGTFSIPTQLILLELT